jgi:hypothetical protein
MNSGREQGAGFGTLTAGVVAGRNSISANVEEYNGTSWTEVKIYSCRRCLGGNRNSNCRTSFWWI